MNTMQSSLTHEHTQDQSHEREPSANREPQSTIRVDLNVNVNVVGQSNGVERESEHNAILTHTRTHTGPKSRERADGNRELDSAVIVDSQLECECV